MDSIKETFFRFGIYWNHFLPHLRTNPGKLSKKKKGSEESPPVWPALTQFRVWDISNGITTPCSHRTICLKTVHQSGCCQLVAWNSQQTFIVLVFWNFSIAAFRKKKVKFRYITQNLLSLHWHNKPFRALIDQLPYHIWGQYSFVQQCHPPAKCLLCAQRLMQLCVNSVQDRVSNNAFKFSSNKTIYMHFCNQRKHFTDPSLLLHKNPIKVETEAKFLGVISDRTLS